jgi:lysophospholipase L1-like esterase
VAKQLNAFAGWAILLSGIMTGVLLPSALLLMQRDDGASPQVHASTITNSSADGEQMQTVVVPRTMSSPEAALSSEAELPPRYQLSYEQWVSQLQQEAISIAQHHPDRLNILAGDSLSLWFPVELLPQKITWLNQGISGETSLGLLRRLKLFDRTQPRTVFVMIGINDLIRGVSDETLIANQREILRHLKKAHPNTRIVLQSILPHGGDRAVQRYVMSTVGDPAPEQNPRPLWVDRLPAIPNDFIRKLNQRLEALTREEKVDYLDLHRFFIDSAGNLDETLTTDGLHLSGKGYEVWKGQLEAYVVQSKAKRSPSKTARSR